MNILADATCWPILPSDSPFTWCEECFVCLLASFNLLHGQLCHLSSFHYVSSKETLLANLEPDVLQRAQVHRTKPKMWESYTFTQRRRSWCCTRSSAPRLPSVPPRETALPPRVLRVKLAGVEGGKRMKTGSKQWRGRATRCGAAQLGSSLRRGSTCL